MQLDLFAHGRDVMLRNDLTTALRACEVGAARDAFDALAAEYPSDALLAAATTAIEVLSSSPMRYADACCAAAAVEHFGAHIEPAARQLFAAGDARRWLAPLWRQLAAAAARLPYDAALPNAHAASMLLRAEDWSAAERAIAGIESWRRIPTPLAWMAEARFRFYGLEAAWPLIAELAWLAAPRARRCATGFDAPAVTKLVHEFGREFASRDDTDFRWFPAWALITEARLASVLRDAATPAPCDAEQAAHTVMRLLALERQGRQREIVEQRRALKSLHEELFVYYMRTRT